MGYSNFRTLRKTLETFDIEEINENLFPEIREVQPSDWLVKTLEIAEYAPLINEKTKSERLISPILMEVAISFRHQITLYSGTDLPVDEALDLNGNCDFFIAKHPLKQVMQAPIISLAEAKDEDMNYGQGQCLAQMYAAQLYNERKNKPQPFIYGCAVTGDTWKFMKLENQQVFIDTKMYFLAQLPKILGIFQYMIKLYL